MNLKKHKKNNTRTCIITGEKLDKSHLIRVVKYQGKFTIDKEQNLPGRGAYLKKDVTFIDKIQNKRILHRAFKENVSNEAYEQLIKYIKGE